MAEMRAKAGPRERIDPAAVRINQMLTAGMIVSTAAAAIMLFAGGWYRADWLIMLGIVILAGAFARGCLMLPAHRPGKKRSRLLKGFQKYRLSGMILAFFYLAMLVFTIVKRKEGFFYPLPVMIITVLYAVFRIAALVLDMRLFAKTEGPYTAGLRILDLEDAVLSVLLIIHVIAAALSGAFVASGFLWIFTAIVSVLLLAVSAYMVVFAEGEIRYYSD